MRPYCSLTKRSGVLNTGRGRPQVFAQVIEIDHISRLRSELPLHLLSDPRGAISDRMNLRPCSRPDLNRTTNQLIAGIVSRA